mmetsp:Transcript_26403/g.35274  ORF Transcript_26403/g.35274 Transcript_26403/m.35274 type:complete len:155 (+) Transcript_26403:461-925(+)
MVTIQKDCVSERRIGDDPLKLLAFACKLMIVMLVLTSISILLIFVTGVYSLYNALNLSFHIFSRLMFCLLRVAIMYKLVQTGFLLDLKLSTQVLHNGRICILGIDSHKREMLRVKVNNDMAVVEAHDSVWPEDHDDGSGLCDGANLLRNSWRVV